MQQDLNYQKDVPSTQSFKLVTASIDNFSLFLDKDCSNAHSLYKSTVATAKSSILTSHFQYIVGLSKPLFLEKLMFPVQLSSTE